MTFTLVNKTGKKQVLREKIWSKAWTCQALCAFKYSGGDDE